MDRIFHDGFHMLATKDCPDEIKGTVASLHDYTLFLSKQLDVDYEEDFRRLLKTYCQLATGDPADKAEYAQYGKLPTPDDQMETTATAGLGDQQTLLPNRTVGGPVHAPTGSVAGQAPPIGSIEDYDPLWFKQAGIDDEEVDQFKSAMKFDCLFTSKVFGIGDTFTLDVELNHNGQKVKSVAMLRVSSSTVVSHSCLDLISFVIGRVFFARKLQEDAP